VDTTLPFTPLRIDSGEHSSVIIGTLGEICKLRDNTKVEDFVKPFPAQITSGVVLENRWVGTWVDHELKHARMAALTLDGEWQNGIGREAIRKGIKQSLDYDPNGAIWSQSLDSEPMALNKVNSGFCFSILGRGIYHMDADSNEIWRVPIPDELTFNRLISINESDGQLNLFYDNGSVIILDKEDGSVIENHKISINNKIEKVFHHQNKFLIAMATGGFSILEGFNSTPSTYRTPGPIFDAKFLDSGWIWTGWRHDGQENNGEIKISRRRDIGVAILNERILSNDGKWSDFLE